MALDEVLARGHVARVVISAKQLAILLACPLAGHVVAALWHVHATPLRLTRRTTTRPSSAVSTPNESTTVCRIRRSVSTPGGAVAVRERLGDRARAERSHPRANAVLDDLEREADAADLARLGEQPLDGELQVVDLLEGEVDALGDASDDQANDRLEVAGERRVELDELASAWSIKRFPDRPVPHDGVFIHEAGELAGRDRVRRLVELDREPAVGRLRDRQASGAAW